jgi:hypothetical protein
MVSTPLVGNRAMAPLQALHAILWQKEATIWDSIFSEFEVVNCEDPTVTPPDLEDG